VEAVDSLENARTSIGTWKNMKMEHFCIFLLISSQLSSHLRLPHFTAICFLYIGPPSPSLVLYLAYT